MKKTLLAALILLPASLWAEGSDDFGVWTEIGLSKSLSKQWSLGVDAEFRSQAKLRGSIGANAEYKPCKYFKAGVFYTFIYSMKPEKREEHYRKDIVDEDHWNGYDIKDADWRPRHRAGVDLTGTVKLWKWLRISVRERYQMTYCPVLYRTETKYRYEYLGMADGERQYELRDDNDDGVADYPTTGQDRKDSWTTHMLRSRLKLAYDKKKCPLSPYVSAETSNVLNDNMRLEKVRTSIGLDYKLSKQHEIGVAYVLSCDIYDDEDDKSRLNERIHALNIGYKYKF